MRAFSSSFLRTFSSFSICSASRLVSLASFSRSLASRLSRSTDALVFRLALLRAGLAGREVLAPCWDRSGYRTYSAVLKDSTDGPKCSPSFVVEGESNEDFPSALIAALLARRPLELFKMEDSLFLTCFNGLSLKFRDGDLEMGVDVLSSSETVAKVGFETDMPFLWLRRSSASSAATADGKKGTEADFACFGALVVRSGMLGAPAFVGEVGLLLGSVNSEPPTVAFPTTPSITSAE